MRSIRIRTFSILSLLLILMLPWVFYVTAHLLTTKSLSFGTNEAQKENFKKMSNFIETNIENWSNPKWQDDLRGKLQALDMGVEILTESNQEIFQFFPEEDHSFTRAEQFSIMQDGLLIGRVMIFQPNPRGGQMIVAFTGLLLAFFIIGYVMRRFILKPLEKMSLAVRQVAEGDLDVLLPMSPIKEITEVYGGIRIMTEGLQDSMQKQVELEEERRFIIAAVAHDLRTPLFALRGYLDGLEEGIADSPDKQARYLAVCKEKSAQLARLVEDLFTFTKTEYLEMELKKTTVNLPNLLKKSIDSLNPLAKQNNISIITNYFGDDCMIMGDSYLLERAINNLLDNAVRHTPHSGKIFIQCYKDGNRVVFTVQDTGKGFSSEEIHRVFDPLYRGEASRNRSTGGVGLGLTISRRVVRRHGGDLVVDNHSEGGALIKGWIPAHCSNA
ncbi:two-component sensor histidine kinase [Pueribacillus theae]|uniref:histidine kinase n=1 Tax=Pueribacillus theae TaxID=2171751 RepID=A0A2U1K6A5_9BACI|nr:HAMP domain-containing sensor histidine kinase [Pueribacillus theae]PWA12493.1 two-component sensor histidine kinase [Pueribacillus theae]